MESLYRRHRFPPEIISHAVWLYHVDEVFITIRGERHYLWKAVDQDGDVLDILVTRHRDSRAATRFFRKVLKHQGSPPPGNSLPTSFEAIRRPIERSSHPSPIGQYENNRAEVSHQHTREQERQMHRFKSAAQVQCFLCVHGPIHNLFQVGRDHLKAVHHRLLRERAFIDWKKVTCVC